MPLMMMNSSREDGYEGSYAKDTAQGQYKSSRWKGASSVVDEGIIGSNTTGSGV